MSHTNKGNWFIGAVSAMRKFIKWTSYLSETLCVLSTCESKCPRIATRNRISCLVLTAALRNRRTLNIILFN